MEHAKLFFDQYIFYKCTISLSSVSFTKQVNDYKIWMISNTTLRGNEFPTLLSGVMDFQHYSQE